MISKKIRPPVGNFLTAIALGLLALAARPAVAAPTGPTLRLAVGREAAAESSVADFMYFVPLISPEPVSVAISPGNTQRTRLVGITRQFEPRSFLVTAEFEFLGDGDQRSVFDHRETIRRHEPRLRQGGVLEKQLGAINVEGAGVIRVEVEGAVAGPVSTVTQVRLRFNGRGRASPVTIDLYDVRYLDGEFRPQNELVARVNSLTFHRQAGPAEMEISVASVKRKNAGNNLWQSLLGGVKGTAVNMFIKPVRVNAAGREAMLDFGRALLLAAATFTFPQAENLTAESPAVKILEPPPSTLCDPNHRPGPVPVY